MGRYIRTERNQLVAQHYEKLGFQPLEAAADGTTVWELDVHTTRIEGSPAIVRRSGFALTEVANA